MLSQVKAERHDEHEINELAKKIAEQNRAKMSSMPPGPGFGGLPMHMIRPGQPGIANYFGGNRPQTSKDPAVVEEKRIDEESRKGSFGYCEFEKNYIPYIFRHNGEKYCSVRMVERKLLNKFLTILPPEVNTCHCIRSYFITDAECKLLNEINVRHNDCHFGKEAFTSKDLVVRLTDAKEFYHFLDLCHKKLVLKRSNSSDRCGFFRINGESVVPYTITEGTKYVPLFYFEGETEHLKLNSETINGWDLAYLKFCCKVQGIRNELFAGENCKVVALEEIKQHFPQGTTFEDYWPAKGSIEPIYTQRVTAGNWTQKPAAATVPMPTASSTAVQSGGGSSIDLSAYDTNTFQQLLRSGMMSNGQHSNQTASLLAQQQRAALHQQQLMRAAQQAAAQQAAAQQAQHAAAAQAAVYAQVASLQLQQQQHHQQQLQQQQQQQQQMRNAAASGGKPFNAKLTQIKEFPIDRSHTTPPYKIQKALIDQKIVPCLNVRPYVFHDLMMTLPDFVRYFYPELSLEKARHMLQEVLKVVLYKGNSGHQEVLRAENKCSQFDPVPLVLVKDIISYMPQMKYMTENNTASESAAKRLKVS